MFRQIATYVVAASMILLAGCVSEATRRQQAEEANRRTVEVARLECARFGFREGTDGFSHCVMQTIQSIRQTGAAAANQQRMMGLQLMQNGMQMLQPTPAPAFGSSPPFPNQMQVNRPIVNANLQRSQVQGQSRLCIYDRLGEQFILAIAVSSQCALTLNVP